MTSNCNIATAPKLLPFQEVGAQFIASRRRALLFDEMRVGKTPQAVRACDLTGARSVLVLCPAIARQNWLNEFRRFGGREGAAVDRYDAPLHPGLTVCGYDSLIDLRVYNRVAKVYDCVILDEAHYLSNPTAKRTDASFKIAEAARYCYALTGTPQRKSPADLWALLRAFDVTRADYGDFMREFCLYRETQYGPDIYGTRNADRLRAMLAPFMIRRRLRDVAPDMPLMLTSPVSVEAGEIDFDVDMPEWRHEPAELVQRARAEELELIAALDEARDRLELIRANEGKVLRRLLGLQKVRPAVEIISEELRDGAGKMVVFAYHRHVLLAMRAMLRNFGAEIIDGSTSTRAREWHQKNFREHEFNRVLLCQVQAAATNIDLSIADDALFVEADWVPATNAQAMMRIASQFKRRPTRARFLSVAGSVDDRIARVNAQRTRMAFEIFS